MFLLPEGFSDVLLLLLLLYKRRTLLVEPVSYRYDHEPERTP